MLEVKVVKKQREAEDVFTFELAPVTGDQLPAFSAGAHIDVFPRDDLCRQYSLCNRPDERHRYVIAVSREPQSRGGSTAMHDQVLDGRILQISEPRNHFQLHAGVRKSLLFAGGIGITPILCMAEALQQAGSEFELSYCGRSTSRMAFVERIRNSGFAHRASIIPDDLSAVEPFDPETAIGSASPDQHLYVCGPPGFMGRVLDAARRLGWDESRLHREYFAASALDHSTDGSFAIELKRSGRTIMVPADQSAAQALAANGVDLPLSCEQGVCGTCITRVLAGKPDHRDLYFTDEEHARNDFFTPCCSRSLSALLVLDL